MIVIHSLHHTYSSPIKILHFYSVCLFGKHFAICTFLFCVPTSHHHWPLEIIFLFFIWKFFKCFPCSLFDIYVEEIIIYNDYIFIIHFDVMFFLLYDFELKKENCVVHILQLNSVSSTFTLNI